MPKRARDLTRDPANSIADDDAVILIKDSTDPTSREKEKLGTIGDLKGVFGGSGGGGGGGLASTNLCHNPNGQIRQMYTEGHETFLDKDYAEQNLLYGFSSRLKTWIFDQWVSECYTDSLQSERWLASYDGGMKFVYSGADANPTSMYCSINCLIDQFQSVDIKEQPFNVKFRFTAPSGTYTLKVQTKSHCYLQPFTVLSEQNNVETVFEIPIPFFSDYSSETQAIQDLIESRYDSVSVGIVLASKGGGVLDSVDGRSFNPQNLTDGEETKTVLLDTETTAKSLYWLNGQYEPSQDDTFIIKNVVISSSNMQYSGYSYLDEFKRLQNYYSSSLPNEHPAFSIFTLELVARNTYNNEKIAFVMGGGEEDSSLRSTGGYTLFSNNITDIRNYVMTPSTGADIGFGKLSNNEMDLDLYYKNLMTETLYSEPVNLLGEHKLNSSFMVVNKRGRIMQTPSHNIEQDAISVYGNYSVLKWSQVFFDNVHSRGKMAKSIHTKMECLLYPYVSLVNSTAPSMDALNTVPHLTPQVLRGGENPTFLTSRFTHDELEANNGFFYDTVTWNGYFYIALGTETFSYEDPRMPRSYRFLMWSRYVTLDLVYNVDGNRTVHTPSVTNHEYKIVTSDLPQKMQDDISEVIDVNILNTAKANESMTSFLTYQNLINDVDPYTDPSDSWGVSCPRVVDFLENCYIMPERLLTNTVKKDLQNTLNDLTVQEEPPTIGLSYSLDTINVEDVYRATLSKNYRDESNDLQVGEILSSINFNKNVFFSRFLFKRYRDTPYKEKTFEVIEENFENSKGSNYPSRGNDNVDVSNKEIRNNVYRHTLENNSIRSTGYYASGRTGVDNSGDSANGGVFHRSSPVPISASFNDTVINFIPQPYETK